MIVLGHNLIYDTEWILTIRYYCNICGAIVWYIRQDSSYTYVIDPNTDSSEELITCNEIIIKKLLE